MTYPDFLRLLLAAGEIPELSDFIFEEGGSVPAADLPLLPIIHRLAQDDLAVRSIAQATGLSMRRLAMDLGIPTRTMEDWAASKRNPPAWQLSLIAYAAISMTGGADE